MRFVEGGQLDQVIKQKPTSIRQAAELISKVARTVHYAHEHGILHRDIKPGNILLDTKGEPLLTDFGLARLVEAESTVTRTKEVMGTPSYMAPEQAVGNNAAVSSATDVYGLGAVLYQLLTGHPPFAGGTTYETIKLVLDSEPRRPRLLNPKIDRDLSTICLKCLEKDPKRRYSSGLALAEDLEHWLKHEPIQARRTGVFTRARKWARRNPSTAGLITLLVTLAVGSDVVVWNRVFAVPMSKSVAVLPFENLSHEPNNAYFAIGVQNEILTRLAKIAALKVISHSSTQQYPSRPSNLSKIARQLGVANVLEGSVQRTADQVHINVQLIRAATEEHLWAESYDRKLENIFGVEAEVATAVADALKAKLSAGEQRTLQKRPTNSREAYDAYLRGLAYSLRPFYEPKDNANAIRYFGEAAKLDPKFALAWAWLGRESALGYFNRIDTDFAALRQAARRAAEKAIELQPDLSEAYIAQGYSYYYGEDDYDSAIASFEKATSLSPNNSEAFEALGLIYRRKGEWQRSLDYLREATELDPRNTLFLSDLAETLSNLRQYSAALKICDQILDRIPNNPDAQLKKISNYQAQGNLPAAAQLLSTLHSAADYSLLSAQVDQWTYERRYADAIASLKEALSKSDAPWSFKLRYGLRLARLQQFSGDSLGARATWQQLQTEAESVRRTKGEKFSGFPLASAYLALGGDETKAFAILEQVTALPSFSKDALRRSGWTVEMAEFAVQAGKKDLALEQVATSARNAAGVDYGNLKFDPVWDPLRGDPRFEKIVASLAPKDTVSK